MGRAAGGAQAPKPVNSPIYPRARHLQRQKSLPVSQLGKPKPSIQGAKIPIIQMETRPSAEGTYVGTLWLG